MKTKVWANKKKGKKAIVLEIYYGDKPNEQIIISPNNAWDLVDTLNSILYRHELKKGDENET